MAWPLVEVVPKAGEEPRKGWSGERLYSENFALPGPWRGDGGTLNHGWFSFNSPYGACPDLARGSANLRTFTFERVGAGSEPGSVYAANRPAGARKDNSYYFSLLFSVGRAFAFEIKQPWNADSTPGSSSRSCCRAAPSRSPVQADSRLRQGSPGLPGGPLKGSCRSWSASCATPAVKAMPPESWRSNLDLVPCGTCHACG